MLSIVFLKKNNGRTEKQYESMQILCGYGHTDFDRNAEETPVLAF
jgi:hypothetical protein